MICKSGPFKVKIAISKIKKVEQNNSYLKLTTFKPAMSQKGYYIYYNNYDSILISAANEALLASTLQSINSNIVFT